MKTLKNNREAADYITKREEFRNSGDTLSGLWVDGSPSLGDLPSAALLEFRRALTAHNNRLYVVYSYFTPIAWAGEDDADMMVPNVRYSITTSKHQGLVPGKRVAMGDPGAFRKGKGRSPYGY